MIMIKELINTVACCLVRWPLLSGSSHKNDPLKQRKKSNNKNNAYFYWEELRREMRYIY